MSNTASTERPRASTPTPLASAFRAGLASARENALPGLFLWVFASAIVAAYFFLEPLTAALDALGRLKARGGFLYSALSTALFGGLIPFLWRLGSHARASSRARVAGTALPIPLWTVPAWQAALFLGLFWAWKGIEVDLLYRAQALVFGNGARFSVIAPKVIVDQFVYNPLWAAWTQVVAYWWLEKGFKPAPGEGRTLLRQMGSRSVTILISTWGIWIPMVSIIYAMPASLQIPLFNIVLCFWGLMLASLSREKRE
jgi:hypothetical protein